MSTHTSSSNPSSQRHTFYPKSIDQLVEERNYLKKSGGHKIESDTCSRVGRVKFLRNSREERFS